MGENCLTKKLVPNVLEHRRLKIASKKFVQKHFRNEYHLLEKVKLGNVLYTFPSNCRFSLSDSYNRTFVKTNIYSHGGLCSDSNALIVVCRGRSINLWQ